VPLIYLFTILRYSLAPSGTPLRTLLVSLMIPFATLTILPQKKTVGYL
jgi:hypothetical protein